MTTFGLVHGGWHAAWWWGPVTEELRAAGHDAIAMDLPCDDPEVLFSGYADVVAEALSGVGEDVVLVGSSLAGMTVPLVARLRPVRAIVLVGALPALPGKSLIDQRRSGDLEFAPGAFDGVSHDELGRAVWTDEAELRRVLYHDVAPELVAQAIPRLRPQATTPYRETCPLDAWPDVPVRYIVCSGDRLVPPEWSRRVARERFGVEPVEIEGGHMPMLTRPAELAAAIAGG